jgi:FtsH-binding integral membrane protein
VFDRNKDERDDREARPADPSSGYSWMSGPTSPTAGTAQPGATAGPVSPTAGAVVAREGFLTASFVWMFLALLVSTAAAGFTLYNERLLTAVVSNYFILFLLLLGMAVGIQAGINRLGAIPALALLFTFAVVNGATLSVVALVYTSESILTAFLGASSVFGAAALYGVVTKRDLSGLGGILFVGLIGIIVVSVINYFIPNGTFSFLIGIAGVVLFTVMTAYDVQRINKGDLTWIKTREAASVIGALWLYIDFINLFLSFLRIFGSRR